MSWMCYYSDNGSSGNVSTSGGLVISEELDPSCESIDSFGIYYNSNTTPAPVIEAIAEEEGKRGGVGLYPAPDLGSDMRQAFSEMVAETADTSDDPGVVLDIMNIGYSYSGQAHFNVDGVVLAIDFFRSMGLGEGRIAGFIPASLVRRRAGDLMETEQLDKINALVARGYITCVHGHDDEYIITYARENNRFIVSNDFYKDHIDSMPVDSMRNSMRHWIDLHIVNYSFVGPDRAFMISPHSQLHRSTAVAAGGARQLKALNAAVSAASCGSVEVLRHLLLARASFLLGRSLAAAAAADVIFVLKRLRGDCPEALLMYAQLLEAGVVPAPVPR